jgi:carbamoyl-phosphate synthase large subunit
MNILIEATGSLTSGYLIHAIQDANHRAIGSDISEFGHGKILCDDFIIMPKTSDPDLWNKVIRLLIEYEIDLVIPSLDEMLLGWSKRKDELKKKGITIALSNPNTLEVFMDKFKAFQFCNTHNILTPKTSLQQKYKLVKPRFGRGGSGIYIGNQKKDMEGMISQDLINGTEYTVDCFFDKNGNPIYIVPRKRIDIRDGKSTKGLVVEHCLINDCIKYIANNVKFEGMINFQFIENDNGTLYFLEVNPRIAGGMALGFAATENWIDLLVNSYVNNKKIIAKPIQYGLRMTRYYSECFI